MLAHQRRLTAFMQPGSQGLQDTGLEHRLDQNEQPRDQGQCPSRQLLQHLQTRRPRQKGHTRQYRNSRRLCRLVQIRPESRSRRQRNIGPKDPESDQFAAVRQVR